MVRMGYKMAFTIDRRGVLGRLAQWVAALGLASRPLLKWAIASENTQSKETVMKLPVPAAETTVCVERALENRRTIRRYGSGMLPPAQLSRL